MITLGEFSSSFSCSRLFAGSNYSHYSSDVINYRSTINTRKLTTIDDTCQPRGCAGYEVEHEAFLENNVKRTFHICMVRDPKVWENHICLLSETDQELVEEKLKTHSPKKFRDYFLRRYEVDLFPNLNPVFQKEYESPKTKLIKLSEEFLILPINRLNIIRSFIEVLLEAEFQTIGELTDLTKRELYNELYHTSGKDSRSAILLEIQKELKKHNLDFGLTTETTDAPWRGHHIYDSHCVIPENKAWLTKSKHYGSIQPKVARPPKIG